MYMYISILEHHELTMCVCICNLHQSPCGIWLVLQYSLYFGVH